MAEANKIVWDGRERRRCASLLTDEQIEDIAEKVAEAALVKMQEAAYIKVGRSIIEKGFYIVGILFLGFIGWAKAKGYLD